MSARADAAAARAGRALLAASRIAGRLVRWGTALHDRWLLPHFVAADIARRRVATSTRRLPVRRSTGSRRSSSSASRASAPSATTASRLELRQAIEPWHVLGEEVSGTGTSRYVDSSVERLQVKVDRHDRRAPPRRVQRPRAAADADRRARRVRRRRALPRVESALGAASDDRRARAAGVRPRRHLGRRARSAAAPTTWCIRAAATTTRSRSTRTKPRRGASRASGRTATRPAR